MPPDRIVEAHGSFGAASCIDCGQGYGREYVLNEGVREGKVVRCRGAGAEGEGESGSAGASGKGANAAKGAIARDSKAKARKGGCGGLVKPDIVFFGEGLPDRFFERMPVSHLQPIALCHPRTTRHASLAGTEECSAAEAHVAKARLASAAGRTSTQSLNDGVSGRGVSARLWRNQSRP